MKRARMNGNGFHLTFNWMNNWHVTATIRFLNGRDMQVPCVMLVVGNANARIACYDVVLHRQNSWPFHVDPSHLHLLYNNRKSLWHSPSFKGFYFTFYFSSLCSILFWPMMSQIRFASIWLFFLFNLMCSDTTAYININPIIHTFVGAEVFDWA